MQILRKITSFAKNLSHRQAKKLGDSRFFDLYIGSIANFQYLCSQITTYTMEPTINQGYQVPGLRTRIYIQAADLFKQEGLKTTGIKPSSPSFTT